jgi:hypothetical protein
MKIYPIPLFNGAPIEFADKVGSYAMRLERDRGPALRISYSKREANPHSLKIGIYTLPPNTMHVGWMLAERLPNGTTEIEATLNREAERELFEIWLEKILDRFRGRGWFFVVPMIGTTGEKKDARSVERDKRREKLARYLNELTPGEKPTLISLMDILGVSSKTTVREDVKAVTGKSWQAWLNKRAPRVQQDH